MGLIAWACCTLFGFDPRDPPHIRAEDRATRRFIEKRTTDNYADFSQEIRLRAALATLIAKASHSVLRRGAEADLAIEAATNVVCRKLMDDDADALRRALTLLNYHDLLSPAAWKKVRDEAVKSAIANRRRSHA